MRFLSRLVALDRRLKAWGWRRLLSPQYEGECWCQVPPEWCLDMPRAWSFHALHLRNMCASLLSPIAGCPNHGDPGGIWVPNWRWTCIADQAALLNCNRRSDSLRVAINSTRGLWSLIFLHVCHLLSRGDRYYMDRRTCGSTFLLGCWWVIPSCLSFLFLGCWWVIPYCLSFLFFLSLIAMSSKDFATDSLVLVRVLTRWVPSWAKMILSGFDVLLGF